MQLSRSFGLTAPPRRSFVADLVTRLDDGRRVFTVTERETGRRAWAVVRGRYFVCVYEAGAFADSARDLARVRVTAKWAARKAVRNGF